MTILSVVAMIAWLYSQRLPSASTPARAHTHLSCSWPCSNHYHIVAEGYLSIAALVNPLLTTHKIINPSNPPAAAIILPAVCLAAAAVLETVLDIGTSVEMVLTALILLVLVL